MARLMATSLATTGWTSRLVMNLMSSMAKMLAGLAMATVRMRPRRSTGSTWNLVATSAGMSAMQSSLMEAWSRSTTGRL